MKTLRIILLAALVLFADLALGAQARRPNILLIITDQQHAGMLGCADNPYVKTPNLDSLAETGARFERAYCANPVCAPSRFSMMTGTMPSRIGMEINHDIVNTVPQEILNDAMGAVFRRAGYQTLYGGKTHVPGSIENYGFTVLSRDERDGLARASATFLRSRRPADPPFLLVASFINPHDICYKPIRAWQESGRMPPGARLQPLDPVAIQRLDEALRLPAGVSEEEFFRSVCPPLPANHGITDGELSLFSFRGGGMLNYLRRHWTERDWRLYRWAYARLTERVDAEIGKVLAALRESGLERNTLVIFTSDHGNMDAAHRLVGKDLLYEEAVRVPLIISWKGVTQAGLVNREHLVSTGLDLIPTMCDFAGVPRPSSLRGRSLRMLAEGRPVQAWRNHLVVENRQSRLVVFRNWKYKVAARGTIREMITHLAHDPGEMKNLASDPAYREHLATGRRFLKSWYESHRLTLDPGYVVSPP